MRRLPGRVLVGRDAELAMARDLVVAVPDSGSATLLVEGEAGIGKSELVQRVAEVARQLMLPVVSGSAHPFEANRPFGVLADALGLHARSTDPRRAGLGRLLGGDTVDGLPGGATSVADVRFLVVRQIVELVGAACADAPLVMILEDVHWADESSLWAVGAIVRELSHMPLLIAVTMRPTPRTAALDGFLDECVRSGARLVSLGPLSHVQVEELVAAQLGRPPGTVLASMVARAGGNPLWVVEMLRSLKVEGWLREESDAIEAVADELPSGFRDLVLRRLRYLPSGTRDVLQLAAVLGEAVSIHDLAAVSGRSARDVIADLEEAFRARLLDEQDEAVVFRHQLVQQAIYEPIPMPVRRALHREAAGALARAGADVAKVASHLMRGGERGDLEAVRWLRRAAKQTATARRARALAEEAGSTAMIVWSLCAGSVAVKSLGRYADALAMAEQAVASAFQPLNLEARMRHPHFFLGMVLADSDRLDEARYAYGTAIGEAADLGTGWLLPDMLALAAEARFLCGEWDDACTELEAATHLAEKHGQRILIAQSRAYRALVACARGDPRRAHALLAGLEPMLDRDHAPYGTEMVAFAAATLAEADGDPVRAFDVLLQCWTHDSHRSIRYYHRSLAPPLVRLGLALDRRAIAAQVVEMVEEGAALAPEVPSVQSAARRCRGLLESNPRR